MTLASAGPNPQLAQEIFDSLVKRIKAKMRSEIGTTFDPSTGLQRRFLHGKLISQRVVRLGSNLEPRMPLRLEFKKPPTPEAGN